MQAQALSMTEGEWTRAHAISGAIFGGIAAPIATAAPIGMIAIGAGGLYLSGTDLIRTVNVVRNETGWTKCAGTRLIIDVAGALGSTAGIVYGARAWSISQNPLKWPRTVPGLWGPRKGTERGASYEEFVRQHLGNPTNKNYIVNNGSRDVYFDALDQKNWYFIDAKESSGISNYDLVRTEEWARVNVLSEARGQLIAAEINKAKVVWYISHPRSAETLRIFFKEWNLPIIVKYFPGP